MAGPNGVRKVPPDIFYKCHPKNKVGGVFCVLCDVAYCKSDFLRKYQTGKGKFITNTMIICDEHDITSLQEDNKKNDRFIIASLKSEIESLKSTLKKTEKNFKEYRETNRNDGTLEAENSLLKVDVVQTCDSGNQCGLLKELNAELKEHNKELRDQNNFLRREIEKKDHRTRTLLRWVHQPGPKWLRRGPHTFLLRAQEMEKLTKVS